MTGVGPATAFLARPTGLLAWLGVVLSVLALVPAGLRWLRVAQREHYLAGGVSRFAGRWWLAEPADLAMAVVSVAGLGLSFRWPVFAVLPAVAVAVGPWHLSPRGRTSPLAWTRRLRLLAGVWLALQALVVLAGVLAGLPAPLAAAGALAVPLLVDVALALTAPVERRLAGGFVASATERLARVAPVVVGVTGSYGKTSTKHHIAHLLAGSRRVVATPASFNNRAGLSRAVNEQLVEGTEVFVAEMGTYGPGEIAEMCRWCPPEISVITAIGPVHLERFGSEDRIVTAKEEITRGARLVVLNVDDPRLAAMADRLAAAGTEVQRCSAHPGADVVVEPGEGGVSLWLDGRLAAAGLPVPDGVQPTNLACAVAVARRLGVAETVLAQRLADVPSVANRLTVGRATSGVVVVDDTFNSNPAGARAALGVLARSTTGRSAVVTPGMVELGGRQFEENRQLGAEVARVADDLVIVGRTNRRALLRGAAALHPVTVATRDEAVAWVRTHLGEGDAVLYENDLPDHYP